MPDSMPIALRVRPPSPAPDAPSARLLAFKSRPPPRPVCSDCGAQRFCLPEGLAVGDADTFAGLVSHRLKIAKGSALFHAPESLINLYAVRVGAFKTTIVDQVGRGQITGFQMPGDILGLDAIAQHRHTCSAVALVDSEVCAVAYRPLQHACGQCPPLQLNFNRIFSQLLVREQNMMLLMGNLSAEQRLATFFLTLSERYRLRGYSATGFALRMSREDISSYLGLRLETVCRAIAHLRERGVIECRGRALEILDIAALQAASEP